MKKQVNLFLLLLFTLFWGNAALHAQSGNNYVKVGSSAFFLSNEHRINHSFLSLGASYEHQFSQQFSLSFNLNTARVLHHREEEQTYIKQCNSLEGEVRFYPNNKGNGFYAGTSLVFYLDNRKTGLISKNFFHLGSHINVGVQFPMRNNYYLQLNGQVGVFGQGFSTVVRYGLNAMAGMRF